MTNIENVGIFTSKSSQFYFVKQNLFGKNKTESIGSKSYIT